MRLQPETVTLGDENWTVRPLTLAQVQAIEPIVAHAGASGSVTAAVGVLRIALSRDHAEAAARLDEVEAAAPEVARAMAVVLRLGGFLPEAASPGEAGAGATPASTGAASTPV